MTAAACGARAGAGVLAARRAAARADGRGHPEGVAPNSAAAHRPLRGGAPPARLHARRRRAPDDRAATLPLRARRDGARALPRGAAAARGGRGRPPRRPAAARRAHAPLRADRRSRRAGAARRRQLRRLERRPGRPNRAGRSDRDRHRGPPRRQLEGRQRRPARRRPRRSASDAGANLDWGDVAAREAQRRRRGDLRSARCSRSTPTTPTRTSAWRGSRSTTATTRRRRDELAPRAGGQPGATPARWRCARELALDAEDWRGAARRRGRHPSHQPARSRAPPRVAAAAALLLDDRAGVTSASATVDLAVHPHDGAFFAFVAEALTRHRRYDEARAVAADGRRAPIPSDAGCLSVAGARRCCAWATRPPGSTPCAAPGSAIPYDVRTYNLLNLYEKVIPARYMTVASAHLRFRVEPAARPPITEVVAPFLEERYRAYVARYGFEPTGPVIFELYGDPRHFAVRTVGPAGDRRRRRLLRAGDHVAGADQPRLQLGHGADPRAGARVRDPAVALARAALVHRGAVGGGDRARAARVDPARRRRRSTAPCGAASCRRWPTLSNAFVNARSGDDAARAYAHAAVAVEFLERRFGFAAIREALVAYGRGERGPRCWRR